MASLGKKSCSDKGHLLTTTLRSPSIDTKGRDSAFQEPLLASRGGFGESKCFGGEGFGGKGDRDEHLMGGRFVCKKGIHSSTSHWVWISLSLFAGVGLSR